MTTNLLFLTYSLEIEAHTHRPANSRAIAFKLTRWLLAVGCSLLNASK